MDKELEKIYKKEEIRFKKEMKFLSLLYDLCLSYTINYAEVNDDISRYTDDYQNIDKYFESIMEIVEKRMGNILLRELFHKRDNGSYDIQINKLNSGALDLLNFNFCRK